MEAKSTSKNGQIIRSLYFYLASLVTLGIAIGSLIFLFNLGLKSWVFTSAEPAAYRLGPPPVLFLSEKIIPETGLPQQNVLVCEESCELTNGQAGAIQNWEKNYERWQESAKNPNADRARDAINGFSFLIVALPLFFIHYRIAQKDSKKSGKGVRVPVRPAYFYFVALASLVMMVISSGVLINLGLKTWIFPSAGEADKISARYEFAEVPANLSEKTAVQSLVDCGESCGLSQETISLADQWFTDYEAWEEVSLVSLDNAARQAAATIPFLVVGIPLFWYHWSAARREAKNKSNQEVSN